MFEDFHCEQEVLNSPLVAALEGSLNTSSVLKDIFLLPQNERSFTPGWFRWEMDAEHGRIVCLVRGQCPCCIALSYIY